MITNKVGRRPGYGTVLDGSDGTKYGYGGSLYSAPPTLARDFAEYSKTFWTFYPVVPAGTPPGVFFYPRLRFIVRLRAWVRKAREAVYNKALVRHYTPSLLGKRQYTNTLARVMKAQGY